MLARRDINRRRTARLPAKLRGEFTMPPSRHSPGNALAESKNGAVARKRMGYQFLPSAAAAAGRVFCRGRLNPCANFHRAGAFASLTPGSRGKPGKQHKQWRAHLETLAALPAERRSLRPAVSLAALEKQARTHSDAAFAERLQARLSDLQRTCKDLAPTWAKQPPA